MTEERIGGKLRKLRIENKLTLRKAASMIRIDVAILSKMERGERRLSKEIVQHLASLYNYDYEELLVLFLSEKVLYEIGEENLALKALKVAEEQLEYKSFLKTDRALLMNKLIAILKDFIGIQKAWVYGSFAREDDGPRSDIDVVLKTDKAFSYFDLAEVQYRAENEIKRKVDVGFIESFKPYIWEHVKPDLKLIYEKG